MTTARGVRNNNPLNLDRTAPRAGWLGAVPDAEVTDPRFEQFTAPVYGLRAAGIELLRYQDFYQLRTPLAILTRWAPAADRNVPRTYATVVAAELGVKITDALNLRAEGVLAKFMAGMTKMEDGKTDYPAELFEEAAQLAISGGAPATAVSDGEPATAVSDGEPHAGSSESS